MPENFTPPSVELQNRIQLAATRITDLLLPSSLVATLCDELEFDFRRRIYSPSVTVWMFILQVISADHSCQQAVARLNSWRVAQGMPRCSSETTSYCKARLRLPLELFQRLLARTAADIYEAAAEQWLFHDREVEMVDGTTVTMADTQENQQAFPQPTSQRPGCGFPMARVVKIISLATGAVMTIAMGPYAGKLSGETSLLRTVIDSISPGKILLADRFYANYWIMAMSEMKQIDLVARVHQLRRVDFRRGLKLGHLDQIVAYRRPKQRPKWMTRRQYDCYPKIILVRHLRYRVTQKGFRTTEITLATTLLDAAVYTADDLADLYYRRWQVELHIRSVKTQMQMEHLRCKSPEMVRKEIYCHLISYNLVRTAMVASALRFVIAPAKLSFTGAMQALEEFAATLRLHSGRQSEQWDNLLETIHEITVGDRPGRLEPRMKKRRPKNYKLMRKPRQSITTREALAC